MKRVNNIFDKICDLDNIIKAHYKARKGKTHYTEVKAVDSDVVSYCKQISETLKNGKFINGKYTIFTKIDKGKERVIYKLPYYPDRIVHHAIMQILEPIWKSVFVKNTYQSIVGRGVHRAKKDIDAVIAQNRHKQLFYLQVDIQKFYPSVDNTIMKDIIRKKIKCIRTLALLDTIIDSTDGLPIGNYLSQYLGNLYLSYFDHHLKENVKVKNYFRYCDDIVVISDNVEELNKYFILIEQMLLELKLTVKRGSKVRELNGGLDFLGFVFFQYKTLLRQQIKTGMYKASRLHKEKSLASYYGWIKASNSYSLWNSVKAVQK